VWAVLALTALPLTAVAVAPPAHAASCAGVRVVVDYGRTGGGISTACAPGDPTSGLTALKASGHRYTFVPRQPGFVCTIDARPNPCNNAPASAYWSYWHARPGGSWTYSSSGAGSFNPRPGSVEGWAFGSGRPPRIRPPAAVAQPARRTAPTTA